MSVCLVLSHKLSGFGVSHIVYIGMMTFDGLND